MWYQSAITSKIVSGSRIHAIDEVYGENTIENLISSGELKPIENPSIIDILKHDDSFVSAVLRYKEIHGCGLKASYDAVTAIKNDMKRYSKPK